MFIPFYSYVVIAFFLFIGTSNRAIFIYDYFLRNLLIEFKDPISKFINENSASMEKFGEKISDVVTSSLK